MTEAIQIMPRRPYGMAIGVATLWLLLMGVAAGWGAVLDQSWHGWRVAFWAAAVWGVNGLLVYYVVGPPFVLSRIAVLSVTFGLVMSVVGLGSYWGTTQLFPTYRVFIERAALFIAACTLMSLLGCVVTQRLLAQSQRAARRTYEWDWGRLRLFTCALFCVTVVGTAMSIRKIGYVPLLSGDPDYLRVEFPAIAGIWLRFSLLGIVVGLLAGTQICARRATRLTWVMGIVGLACASLYGNRFFAAFPVGAVVLLWDQVRARIPVRAVLIGLLIAVPTMALLGQWRQQDESVVLLGPIGMVLFGTLGEFRDLGWTMEYYASRPLLHGSTLGGLVVPLLPNAVWSLVGVDKGAIYAHSNAAVLAQEMGQTSAQRVGLYGELFMNFGWIGSLVGALLYGLLVGYLDRRFLTMRAGGAVRGVILAVVAVATIYAQVGQWNMLTSTITSTCYPILLTALFAARRTARAI